MNSRKRFSSLIALVALLVLVAGAGPARGAAGIPGVPDHVQTSIQDLCYAATCWHPSQLAVPLQRVATMVTWAFADPAVAGDARRAGIRTIAYLDPSIQYEPRRAALASDSESTYRRARDGSRARVLNGATPDGVAERISTYASFLLAYAPQYSVLQEALHSAPSGVPVYPETTLVPLAARASAGDDIDALRRNGAYVRDFSGPVPAVPAPASDAIVVK